MITADGGIPEPSGRPGRRRTGADAFRGRAGQLAVMAELLYRGCNAAIPEVDTGTDVFAFIDGRPEVVRIQVKTCSRVLAYKDGSGYAARFALPIKQLDQKNDDPPLYTSWPSGATRSGPTSSSLAGPGSAATWTRTGRWGPGTRRLGKALSLLSSATGCYVAGGT